ncbi:MAG: methyltransferase [Bacteroidales bacterium]|nr:methyltransferase [Bacteroidales bacterium]
MSNKYFRFKQFIVYHDRCAMKVGTDGILLGAWTNVAGMQRILDVGTGTGLIALMLAQRSDAIIDAVEIDQEAAWQAEQNVAASPWSHRMRVHPVPFQEFSLQNAGTYDLIVSNPPYFQHAMKPASESRITARHDIKLSYRDLIRHAGKLLTPYGKISVIIPYDLSVTFTKQAWFSRLYPSRILNVRSTSSKPFTRVIMELSGQKNHRPVISDLTLMQEDSGTYTEEYKKLTTDFYL